MSPKAVVHRWLEAFNANDADTLASLYSDFATNHLVPRAPYVGREAIRTMYAAAFQDEELMYIPDNVFEDQEWAVLECYDYKGSRSCHVFHIIEGMIVFQRGYSILTAP